MTTIEDFFLEQWRDVTLNLYAKYDLEFDRLAREHGKAVANKLDYSTLNIIDADLNTAFRRRETARKILDLLEKDIK